MGSRDYGDARNPALARCVGCHAVPARGAPARPGRTARTSSRLQRWRSEAGPSWTARLVFDRIAVPFCRALGFEVLPVGGDGRSCRGLLHLDGAPAAVIIAFPFGQEPGVLWRESVPPASARGCAGATASAGRSAACSTPREPIPGASSSSTSPRWRTQRRSIVALNRPRRTPFARRSRRPPLNGTAPRSVTRCSGRAGSADPSDRCVRRGGTKDDVPVPSCRPRCWTNRSSSFIASSSCSSPKHAGSCLSGIRSSATATPSNRFAGVETLPRPRGLWEALQAIARLAHGGCRAGTLRVPPFNGRLFSPVHAPLAETAPLDDGAVREALLALTTRRTPDGRERIAYARSRRRASRRRL